MARVGVINYGAGNVASVIAAVENLGAEVVCVQDPGEIELCERLILPGVGASNFAMSQLMSLGLVDALSKKVLEGNTPFLGICVGMQVLADRLSEFGEHNGLGWINGNVDPLEKVGVTSNPIPHMGWNDVDFDSSFSMLVKSLGRYRSFFFSHSYAFVPDENQCVCATVEYGSTLIAGVQHGSVIGVQFHPEKSQIAGEIFLEWFLRWDP